MTVLLGGHGECIAILEHFSCNLRDRLVGIAVLVHLDEVCILSPASGIEYHRNLILMRNAVDFLQVCHGNRLAANRVVGNAGENQRNVLGADALDQLLELLDVHVALEGVLLILAAFRYFVQQFLVVQVARNGAHLLDVALGGIEMAVGRDGKLLAGVTAIEDIANNFHQDGLSCTTLLDNEGVRALHLLCATIEEAALILAEVNFVHHFLYVATVGAHEVDDLLPVLLAAALKDVAEGIEQYIITGVAAIRLVAEEQRRPLLVGHRGGAGVGQHINGQHTGREREFIPVSCIQSALALLNRNVRQIANSKREMMGCGYIQRVVSHVLVHINYLHFSWRVAPLFLEDTPGIDCRFSASDNSDWRTVSFTNVNEYQGMLQGRDNLNLDQCILGQARYLNGRASRVSTFTEECGIHFIHRAKVVHITEEHGGLYNTIHTGACLG